MRVCVGVIRARAKLCVVVKCVRWRGSFRASFASSFFVLFVLDVAWASLGIDAFVVIRFAKGRSRRRSFVIVDDRNPR